MGQFSHFWDDGFLGFLPPFRIFFGTAPTGGLVGALASFGIAFPHCTVVTGMYYGTFGQKGAHPIAYRYNAIRPFDRYHGIFFGIQGPSKGKLTALAPMVGGSGRPFGRNLVLAPAEPA
tara:strand:- start:5107 stop:5463 length:357 start_codon:yes stop_codon:yes gene_type:complete